jgi:hypothetical protein
LERALEHLVSKGVLSMSPMILACIGVVTAMVIGFVIVRGKRA